MSRVFSSPYFSSAPPEPVRTTPMTTLRRFLPLLVIASLLAVARPAAAQEEDAPPAPDAAVEAATAWLALVDSGAYDESYETASGILKQSLTAEQWSETITNLKAQLATLETAPADSAAAPERTLVQADYTTELPNAPAGEYVVAQYQRRIGAQPIAEVVVLTLENEAWRVAGYFARPEQP